MYCEPTFTLSHADVICCLACPVRYRPLYLFLERMPKSSESSDSEELFDLTSSLPASAFSSSSLPNSLERRSNGGFRRSESLKEETDGNSLGTPKHLARGSR